MTARKRSASTGETFEDPAAAWRKAEDAYRAEYVDAYWRTVAFDDGVALAGTIDPDGPHVDYAGNLVANPTSTTPAPQPTKTKGTR